MSDSLPSVARADIDGKFGHTSVGDPAAHCTQRGPPHDILAGQFRDHPAGDEVGRVPLIVGGDLKLFRVALIAIKTAFSTPMVMGTISTLVDGNISNIGSRLWKHIHRFCCLLRKLLR